MPQKSLLSKTTIKTTILQTAGPVSTSEALRRNWKFCRCVTVKQFQAAAAELEAARLGYLKTVHKSRLVFIKKPPAEVMEILRENPSLCSPEVYESRYNMPAPKSIEWNIRSSLVSMGLVAQKQFM